MDKVTGFDAAVCMAVAAVFLAAAVTMVTGCSVENDQADEVEGGSYFKEQVQEQSGIFGDEYASPADSKSIKTTAETYAELAERGFDNVGLAADADMKGKRLDDPFLGKKDKKKHPSYYTERIETKDGRTWVLSIVNNQFHAISDAGEDGVQQMLAEDDKVVEYDMSDNMFKTRTFKQVESASGGKVKVTRVDKVCMETLEQFS